MRIECVVAFALTGAVSLCGCAASSSNEREPLSFPITCRADQNAAECLRTVSEFCGSRGYDLYDSTGKAITVAELKYDKATARCRTSQED